MSIRELLFLHKNNTMAILLKTVSVWVSSIQIMQIRDQNKGKRVWKSRYDGYISPLHPEMSSTVYPSICVRERGKEYVRPCVEFFSSCTYSFFCSHARKWLVSLISISLHLHLCLHYIYIYYSTTSFKHETSHFLA